MKLVKNIGLLLVAIIVIIIAIILVRTMMYGKSSDFTAIDLPTPPLVDTQSAAENLGKAIRIRTVTLRAGDPQVGQDQPWYELRAMVDDTYTAFTAATTRDIVANHTMIYTWTGTDASLDPLILMAHQDVVPINMATIDDWDQKPFSGVIADGAVWGRGAIDDKGSMIMILEAAEALAKQNWQPKRTIIFVFGHDEEVAGRGAQTAFALLKERNITPALVLDEGGVIIDNNPMTGKPASAIGISEKGYVSIELLVKAEGGHSSMPPRESGAVKIARAITALEDNQMKADLSAPPFLDSMEKISDDLPFTMKMVFANTWLFGGAITAQTESDVVVNAMLRTTTAPTMLNGSVKDNILPQSAGAVVNFRIHPSNTVDDVVNHVKETTAHIGDVQVSIYKHGIGSAASPVSDIENEAYKMLEAVAHDASGGAPTMPMLTLGGTDARYAHAISEDRVYRFLPTVFTDETRASFHGKNEKLTLENIDRMTKAYGQLMMVFSE